tara:strand:- start:96 stop:494 length:399 start_codon:yes stop_codon:yes gene_type:complete
MAEAQIIELLVNGSANAAFAGFLLWQFFYQQKRLDARDKRSEEREDALRTKYEADQTQLRARYDSVIKMYQENEAKIKDSIISEIGQIDQQLDQVEKKVDELTSKLHQLSEIVQELKMREIARSSINGTPIA